MGTAVREWLDQLEQAPDIVVVLGADPRFLRPARRWAARRQIPIVVDVVDWYNVREGTSIGEKIFIAVNNLWAMPRECARCDGVIAVSEMLAQYFRRRGMPTLRVPAVILTEKASGESAGSIQPRGKRLQLAYIGAAGNRDSATVDNLRRLSLDQGTDLPEITIHLAGAAPARARLRAETGLRATLVEHGRVPRAVALELLASIDLTVLQRPPERRFAKAGFPSKVAESLLMGIPVLVNATSDLREYVTNEVNGVFLADDSYEALRQGVLTAALWRDSDHGPDRTRIAAHAQDHFSPRGKATAMHQFLGDILGRGRRQS